VTRSSAAVGGVAAAGLLAACLAWPRINDVETGRTPEYPDLQPRTYGAGEDKVAAVVKAVIARLPRWTLVGAISGTRGTDLQAEHVLPVLPLKDDVTVRLRRQGGRTQVSVRSRSRTGPWDFGQNARNIRDLLAELDREMERPGR
jgi:uncharacterized protein (DUF1499 family)